MSRFQLHLLGTIGGTLLVFGLSCLNYTEAGGLDHHREFAEAHGLPGPSQSIL